VIVAEAGHAISTVFVAQPAGRGTGALGRVPAFPALVVGWVADRSRIGAILGGAALDTLEFEWFAYRGRFRAVIIDIALHALAGVGVAVQCSPLALVIGLAAGRSICAGRGIRRGIVGRDHIFYGQVGRELVERWRVVVWRHVAVVPDLVGATTTVQQEKEESDRK